METLTTTIDIGNTAFMLVCTSLVMLMTPGLAFFYGGLVSRQNVLTIMIQSFASMGWTTVIWFMFGYSMCFGPTWYGIIGDPTYYAFFNHVTPQAIFAANDAGIPLIVHIAYQMMFAIITPALITGAFANRVTFKAYMLFLTFWLIFVYFPFVHMIWSPNGLFAKWGVLDFAGGIVVHNTCGFAALASVMFVGARKKTGDRPHNVPLIALGTGLLWFGWYGFNAGSELRVDMITASSFLATDLSASFAAITWLIVERIHKKRTSFIGLLTGAVAGLATITPAAGYVSLTTACFIGVVAGCVCYATVVLVHKLGLDDALDVFGVHGMGGLIGSLLLGIFGSLAWNPNGANGLIFGGYEFFYKQVVVVVCSSIWAFVFTYLMLWVINRFITVRVTEASEHSGLDADQLGENAYER
ncbi:ammonium transporter, Amt family [Pseudomonas helmanticensis]|uniref:Ammonium transporter, Amt family n=1 Tax=Pseudomonas helmanticensis TaxID=1471381 RepID=A0ACD2UDD6_9PSED|nr:ammonium transporter [Pseudomonas helmanticensis]SMQ30413.1 ammonium transporter, Amt family [Pseudomonas helmanticensis]